MYDFVKKIGQINVRVKPDLKADLETLAEYHGLTVSSYVHSVLVREVRRERLGDAEIFRQVAQPKTEPAKVVARISPANDRREAQRMIDEADTALKTGMPLSKTGSAITADKIDTKHKRRTG